MKIKVVSSSVDQEKCQYGATYVIDDGIAFDAGSLGFSSLNQQRRVRHVFLSHTHLDHLNSLPQYLDNVYEHGPDCPVVYGSLHVLECLQRHFFNDQIWPDLSRLSQEESPFVRCVELRPEVTLEVEGLKITPIDLDHVVPCHGFLIEGRDSSVALISDTGPTDAIWSCARSLPNLRAVFVEAAFPNSYTWLAERSKHLTPAMLRDEYGKLGRDVAVVVIHIKPAFYAQVVQELQELRLPRLIIAEPNGEYFF